MIVATPALELARADPLVVRQVGQRIHRMGHEQAHRKRAALATVFREARSLYSAPMSIFLGWGDRARGLFTDTKGPWGSSGAMPATSPPPG